MNPTGDITYELSNDQRRYFGLHPVEKDWEKVQLSDTIAIYFSHNRIVKILNFESGYVEYDTYINTIDRQILIPQTDRGKQQKLTLPKILKIKGSGVQFSGSFLGGNIHVYDNRRNVFFIRSFPEDGDMRNYEDIDRWASNYIAGVPPNYFKWLNDQLVQEKLRVKIKAGDIIAFELTKTEFGFARILCDVFTDIKSNTAGSERLYWFHPRSLIVAPYAFFANTKQVNTEELIQKPTLPAVCIFDMDVYHGEMPIIGHKPLSEREKQIPFPTNRSTSITLNITKADIEAWI